jgi:hypothetical protein
MAEYGTPITQTPTSMLDKRSLALVVHGELKRERSSWDPHWEMLSNCIQPRRTRFVTTDRNKGDRRNQNIVDNSATLASRTLQSGMHAGISSPARPWFNLTTFDPDMAKFGRVKAWLWDVTRRMQMFMMRSNIYNSFPIAYGDMGIFGTQAMAMQKDPNIGMRTHVFPLGSYALSVNQYGIADTFMREYQRTVRQIVEEFVWDDTEKKFMWENVSVTVKNLWDAGTYEAPIEVFHVIMPNVEFNPNRLQSKYKKYASVHFELGNSVGKSYLRESGMDRFPILGSRWDVLGDDVYGVSPGMIALGDTKALQIMQKRKAQAVEKIVNPPMTGPTSLKSHRASIVAGDMTYVDVREGQQGFKPAHEVRISIEEIMLDIADHQKRISRAFYEDLFLQLTMSTRREMTAREVEERHDEKLIMLGPVLERLNDELLDPAIDLTFDIMWDSNLIPPPPPELQGQPLRVEYVSIMAQAQKSISIGSIERFSGYVSSLAAVAPESVDRADWDELIKEYGEVIGVTPRGIRSDELTMQIRASRAQQQQAAQASAMALDKAKSLKMLSDAQPTPDSLINKAA